MHLNTLTIAQARKGLDTKEFSATELVSDCFDAITKHDPEIRAFLDVYGDALAEAKRRDEDLSNNHAPPPLFGIPLAIKDNILIQGRTCTAGSHMLKNYQASYDATVISKLKAQGAVILGKTNMDEFAMGSSTEHSAFGPTQNPRAHDRVPGGSSGGSAAAVAAQSALGALGSDTGGSIRQPASFCGVVGLKPTYGAVSRHGLIAMASSLDAIGPLAKTVEDTGTLFRAIRGKDAFDATAIDKHAPTSSSPSNLQAMTIGVPKEYFGNGLDEDIEHLIKTRITKLEQAGATIREVSLPHVHYALAAYYIIVPSEISANLARFDGIRFGHQSKDAHSLEHIYRKTRQEGFGEEVKRRIMLGTYALSAGYYDAYYLKAQKVRRLIRKDFEHALSGVDILLGPTTPTPAFRMQERTQDPVQMYLADVYTAAVNLAGNPALSLPAGTVERDGTPLPVGLQLIAPWHQEEALLSCAHMIESITN